MADIEVIVQPTVIDVSVSPVVIEVQPVDPSKIGPAGPAGPVGPAGDGLVDDIAGTILLGHRAVIKTAAGAIYADANTTDHAYRVFGVTQGSALTSEPVVIVQSGTITEPSWSFTPGPVWLSSNGQLTQSPSSTAFILIIGEALTPTTLFVSVGVPVFTN